MIDFDTDSMKFKVRLDYGIANRSMDFFEQGRTEEDLEFAGLTVTYDWDSVSLVFATSHMKLDLARLTDASTILPPAPWLFRETKRSDLFTQEVRCNLAARGRSAGRWARSTWIARAMSINSFPT